MNRRMHPIMILFLAAILLLVGVDCFGQGAKKQQSKETVSFYFRFNSALLMRDYRSNVIIMTKLDSLLKNDIIITNLDSVIIAATASPEGSNTQNIVLAKKRAKAVWSYLTDTYQNISTDKMKMRFSIYDWQLLAQEIKNDKSFPYLERTLTAISSGTSSATIEWRLRRLANGEVFAYLVKNHLWKYTSATTIFYYMRNITTPFTLDDNVETVIAKVKEANDSIANKEIKPQVVAPIKAVAKDSSATKPILAIKTNLLFDLATAVNIEVEVPIGKRFSLACEWVFPWWTMDNGKVNSKRNRLQILNGNIEAKYWWGNRDDRPLLTGWFTGAYGGKGKYDFEYKGKGFQDHDFWMAGISAGYAHTINHSGSLRMEYSIGVGYLQTNYDKYNAYFGADEVWHAVRQESVNYSWIGPNKAKVSLVWMLNKNYKIKTKGAAR